MIGIFNITGSDAEKARYRVQINEDIICTFEHSRSDGLGLCLLAASKAVERKRWEDTRDLVDKMYKMDKNERE